jgi:magnesium-transporting ATPase (P-type)
VNIFSIIPNLLVAPIVGVLMIIIFQYVFLASSLFADIYIFVINLLVDVFVLILNISAFFNYFVLDFFY